MLFWFEGRWKVSWGDCFFVIVFFYNLATALGT